MNRRTRALLASVALVLPAAVWPSETHAFGNATHIAVANAMLDELEEHDFTSNHELTFVVNGDELELDVGAEEIYEIIIANPAYFRAGALGPNAFPDPISGKLFFSGDGSELLR